MCCNGINLIKFELLRAGETNLSATEPLLESLISFLVRLQDWGIPNGWLDVMSWKTHEPQDHRHSGALHQHC